MKKGIVIITAIIVLILSSCHNSKTDEIKVSDLQTEKQDSLGTEHNPSNKDTGGKESSEALDSSKISKRKITKEMADEGVSNYCHSKYDWSIANENPSIMYISMGEETESEYQVIFRSYTGAYVYFYVNKTSGSTRMVEYVPTLDIENEIGTINIFDYIPYKR